MRTTFVTYIGHITKLIPSLKPKSDLIFSRSSTWRLHNGRDEGDTWSLICLNMSRAHPDNGALQLNGGAATMPAEGKVWGAPYSLLTAHVSTLHRPGFRITGFGPCSWNFNQLKMKEQIGQRTVSREGDLYRGYKPSTHSSSLATRHH